MVKTNITRKVEVDARTISLYCKIRDMFNATLLDQTGETICDYEGYVPDFMPGDHFGDYIILDIDLETGLIKNWHVPTEQELEEFIEQCNGES